MIFTFPKRVSSQTLRRDSLHYNKEKTADEGMYKKNRMGNVVVNRSLQVRGVAASNLQVMSNTCCQDISHQSPLVFRILSNDIFNEFVSLG